VSVRLFTSIKKKTCRRRARDSAELREIGFRLQPRKGREESRQLLCDVFLHRPETSLYLPMSARYFALFPTIGHILHCISLYRCFAALPSIGPMGHCASVYWPNTSYLYRPDIPCFRVLALCFVIFPSIGLMPRLV
jgi:hypothetical protein